jgi:hypothetical protein
MAGYRNNEEVAQVSKPTRLDVFKQRVSGVSHRMKNLDEGLGAVADRLFGNQPPTVANEKLQSVHAGEYNELDDAIDYLEFVINRLEETSSRLFDQA